MALNNKVTFEMVVDFVESRPQDVQDSIGDILTPEGYQRALEALEIANGGSADGAKRTHEAKPYEVLLLNDETGTFESLGVHLGSVGKPPSDPAKWSDLQKCVHQAEGRVFLAKRKGESLRMVKIPASE